MDTTTVFTDPSPTHWTDLTSTENSTSSNATSDGFPKYIYPVIAVEMLLSMICLVFSMFAYRMLPEFKNVHGKNLTSLSGSLLSSYCLLTLDVLVRKRVSSGVCVSIAVGVHVTFLATFFWTNVMAFDIYKTIADLKPRSEVKSRSRRFLKYSFYAWISTFFSSTPAFLLEWMPWLSKDYRPNFGKNRCWISGLTSFLLYFNLPVGVILFSNSVMFLLTVRKLRQIKKMTRALPANQQQKRLNLYLKLFLVMGITWLSEFLPLATGVRAHYALAGMLTALHGVFLFLIFVAKKKILRQMWERCCCCKAAGDRLRKISRSQPTLSTTTNSRI